MRLSIRPIREPTPIGSRSGCRDLRGGSLNKSEYYAGFLQDKWKLNSQLTLSLGLRYDLEVIPIRETDNPLFANPDDYPVDKNNFQPRLGFAYGMDEGKKERPERRLRAVL